MSNTTFDEQFQDNCKLLGLSRDILIDQIGEPDESQIDENGKEYLYYYQSDILITIPYDYKVTEFLTSPIKTQISKKIDGFYNFHGINLGDTRNEILNIWGTPTGKETYVWAYGNKSGTTLNGYHFEIRLLFDTDNPNVLSGFGGMLYDYGEESIKEKKTGGCFIATACYGSCDAEEVLILRQFRDQVLLKSYTGKVAVKLYYLLSPPFSRLIKRSNVLKAFILKYLLGPIVAKIRQD